MGECPQCAYPLGEKDGDDKKKKKKEKDEEPKEQKAELKNYRVSPSILLRQQTVSNPPTEDLFVCDSFRFRYDGRCLALLDGRWSRMSDLF